MSYVLDALRRADAQRQSGAVPTLHAQAASPPVTAQESSPVPRWGLALAAALALLAAAAVALWWSSRTAPAPAAAAAPPARTAAPAPAPAERATAAPRPVPPMPVQRRPAPPAPAEPALPKPAAEDVLVPLAQLPDALRRQLPSMAFGGATDSTVASARMLIVNGRILREGDEVAPGLVLERIALRSAQMRFQGRRFEVAY